MGTRHLTAVRLNGEYKIAQYGQWDGYPEGAGLTVLEFVRYIQLKYLDKFKEKVSACHWITKEEISKINAEIETGINWKKVYPQFDRDTGVEILALVSNSDNGIPLKSDLEFAFDHLFCEYVWCIDLDENVFGLYFGDDETHTLKPVKTWAIGFAPSKDEFLKAFEDEE